MDTLEFIAHIIEYLAWPTFAVIALLMLRKTLQAVVQALANRIGLSESLTISGPEGFEFTSTLAQEARILSLTTTQEQLSALAFEQADARPQNSGQARAQLETLANEYLAIKIPDYWERLKAKNQIADKLGVIVVSKGIFKQELASATHEGLWLAFASAVSLRPEPSDTKLALSVGARVKRLHVRYRLMLGFVRLIETGHLRTEDFAAFQSLVECFKDDADVPLLRLLNQVEALIEARRWHPTANSVD